MPSSSPGIRPTSSIMSAKTRIADHAAVPDALLGTGTGLRRVERLVADALAEGWKIVPLCPFVKRQRAKHPEWADAFDVWPALLYIVDAKKARGQLSAANTQPSLASWGGVMHNPFAIWNAASTLGT